MMKKKNIKNWQFIFGAVLMVIALVSFVNDIQASIRYMRVYENPIYVDAEVTRIDDFTDTDDDVTYISYVDYTVDGKQYKNICYDSSSVQSKLEPIGTRLRLAVDPEDHGQLLKGITSSGLAVFSGSFLACMTAFILTLLRKRRANVSREILFDRTALAQNLLILIRARFFRVFWMLVTLCLIGMHIAFPVLYGWGYLIAGLVTALFWLLCIFSAVHDTRKVRDGNFTIRYDTLEHKEEKEDSDTGTSYYLYYSNGEKQWNHLVGEDEYRRAEVGSTVQSVYLAGEKRPIIICNGDKVRIM